MLTPPASLSRRLCAAGASAVIVAALGAGACRDALIDVADGAGSGAGAAGFAPTPCQEKFYACGDTLDNDADGLTDSADPDCLGPCDNSEDSYYPNLPGSTGAPCKLDCFWDNGNGSGDDGCVWDHRCDPLAVAPDFPPEGASCAYDAATKPAPGLTCTSAAQTQPSPCSAVCGPLTPNGCDCFGCCELPAGSGAFVWLGVVPSDTEPCSAANLGDPTACPPCTPVVACLNPCDPCELCAGKQAVDAGCAPAVGQCAAGIAPCGAAGEARCPAGMFCVTGCCVAAP